MDGNRRGAHANNLPSYEGHRKGAENLWDIINNIQNLKLKFFTVFVFSTENWKRSNTEISFLMKLILSLTFFSNGCKSPIKLILKLFSFIF